MKKKIFTILVSGLLSPLVSLAWHVDGFLSGGGMMPRLTNQESVLVFDGLVNHYDTQRRTDTQLIWGGGGALRTDFPSVNVIDISVGLAGYALNFGTIKGVKHPYANLGDFDPLLYAFKANSSIGAIEARFAYTPVTWQPYILLGVGMAENELRYYQEMPLGAAVAGQLFTKANHRDTAVEAGFGIQHKLFEDVSGKQFFLALDYRYFNTGAGHLGPFSGQTTRSRLRINHLETDALLLTLNVTV